MCDIHHLSIVLMKGVYSILTTKILRKWLPILLEIEARSMTKDALIESLFLVLSMISFACEVNKQSEAYEV